MNHRAAPAVSTTPVSLSYAPKPPDIVRGQVFKSPGKGTARGKPLYSYVVWKPGMPTVLSTGRSVWGAALAICLNEVARFREDLHSEATVIVIEVRPEYGLDHPWLAYRISDHIVTEIRGFHTEEQARAWTMT